MQREKASRSLPATSCHAASLMGSAQGKPSYCSPCTTSLHPPSPCFVDCGTLPQRQSDCVSCTSVWSCARKIRQEQWERPPAPAQAANRSKLRNSAWKPLCCLWMKADRGVARGRLLQVEPMSCTHSPIILSTPGWEYSCTLKMDVFPIVFDVMYTWELIVSVFMRTLDPGEAKPIRIFFFHLCKNKNYSYLT